MNVSNCLNKLDIDTLLVLLEFLWVRAKVVKFDFSRTCKDIGEKLS